VHFRASASAGAAPWHPASRGLGVSPEHYSIAKEPPRAAHTCIQNHHALARRDRPTDGRPTSNSTRRPFDCRRKSRRILVKKGAEARRVSMVMEGRLDHASRAS